MIGFETVVRIHNKLIDEFGGSMGVRDKTLLESALSRPFATFDGEDLYPTAVDKAAAIFESLIINHPFTDGNKRIAYVMMELLLRLGGLHLPVAEDEKYKFVISASTGETRFDEIKLWLEANTKPISE
jgi:death on curing protein